MAIPKKVRQDFFRTWSRDMAYVLGFFAADGCMIQNKRGGHFIEFHITDREVLVAIRSAMRSNHTIAVRTKNPKHKTGYRLQIGSKRMFGDLQALGLTPRKSNILAMPDVPTKYFGDFVRGYFDGDGCVYFKKHYAKDRGKTRYVFATRFTCGSRAFLLALLKNLRRHSLEKGFILEKQNSGYELIFSHRDSVALFHIMYDTVPDNGLYLARKYRKYQLALGTLYGKMRV